MHHLQSLDEFDFSDASLFMCEILFELDYVFNGLLFIHIITIHFSFLKDIKAFSLILHRINFLQVSCFIDLAK